MTDTTIDLSLEEIFKLAKTALMKYGANEENAEAVSNTVTIAERDGSISHTPMPHCAAYSPTCMATILIKHLRQQTF